MSQSRPRLPIPALAHGAAAALVLVACTPDAQPADTDACGANDYAALVGANIAAVTLPADRNIRVLGPDSMATMDYNPKRLNIETDADGTILQLRCG